MTIHFCKCGHRSTVHPVVQMVPTIKRGGCSKCDCIQFSDRVPNSDDITRNLHGGNDCSEQANLRFEGRKDSLAQLIWTTVQKLRSATLHEIIFQLRRDYPVDGRKGDFDAHKVSPRIAELKRAGMLEVAEWEPRRGDANVLVVKSLFSPQQFKESRVGKAAAGGAQ